GERRIIVKSHAMSQLKDVVDHADMIVAGLTRDIAAVPRGPARALECDKRRAEVFEGIGQIMRLADATEKGVRETPAGDVSDSEFDSYVGRLQWGFGMLQGLRRGSELLVKQDTCARPSEVWSPILSMLSSQEQRMMELCDELSELAKAAEEEPCLPFSPHSAFSVCSH
ncbi:unnamed protein product, partial [Prorocentrum cordatum]